MKGIKAVCLYLLKGLQAGFGQMKLPQGLHPKMDDVFKHFNKFVHLHIGG